MARIGSDRLRAELRQRWMEIAGIVVVTILLSGVSRLETRLYELSTQLAKDDSFIASIFFYGIINLNVFLAIILSFLVIRNIAKLVVERRRGVFGSRLRTKLVATLMIFALTPTVIVFYVSTRFINQSFDEWFGGRIREVIQQARDAGGQIYLQDQRRLEGIARVAASKVIVRAPVPFLDNKPYVEVGLDGFELEYGIYSVQVFDRDSKLLWSSLGSDPKSPNSIPRDRQLVGTILGRFATRPGLASLSIVDADEKQDIVRAAVPLHAATQRNGELAGLVIVEERFDMPFLRSIEKIMSSFSSLKPGAQLLRVSYLILVTVMTLMIVFGAVWFGFRVARAIIGPIQILAEATREVALGNYAITLTPVADDETGQLMKSFNTMTGDLERHRKSARDSQIRLQLSNEELERRRRYMEVVFANIAAGVIAVDANEQITAFNHAASSMLKLSGTFAEGSHIKSYLGAELYSMFWSQLMSDKRGGSTVANREIDLRPAGVDLVLFIASTSVKGEDGEDLGLVVVFDDATQRVKQQRVMAWREVASRIAHEIKNPITPIKLSAERLLRRFRNKFEGEDDEVFKRCVESILIQVESLRTLVNEFGKFARLPTIRPVLSDLIPVIRSSIDVFVEGYPSIAFKFDIQSFIPPIMVDPEQMNRALVNIIGNAVDAMMEASGSGQLTVTCGWDKSIEKIIMSIADSGPGIPVDIKDRVFEPYVSSKSGGTGLGLAIASQTIAEHGGYVRIAKSDSEGTTIRIELPPADRYDSNSGANG